MRTTARFKDTDRLVLAITMEMTLSDWKAMNKQLSQLHPSWKLGNQINDAVSRAERTFYVEAEHD